MNVARNDPIHLACSNHLHGFTIEDDYLYLNMAMFGDKEEK